MRITDKRLRGRLAPIAEMAREAGLDWRESDGTIGRAGALDIESNGYGYGVSITTKDWCSGVRMLSSTGLSAAECWQFLDGMAVALHAMASRPRAQHESVESRELALSVENDGNVWPPIARRLSQQWADGTFSLDSAIARIELNGCAPVARRYVLENCGIGDSVASVFPKSVRMAAAEQLARRLVAEFKLGNLWE